MNPSLNLSEMPPHVRLLVETEVRDQEAVAWAAQPVPLLFAQRALPKCLFGALFAAFAIVWMAGASGGQWPWETAPPDLFPMFGLPFLLIGLFLLSAPLWAIRKARNTAFVITDKRAIVLEAGRTTTASSYAPSQLLGIVRRERKDGSGDLIFRREVSYDSEGAKGEIDFGFTAIRDVKGAEDAIHFLTS